jgi:4-hydroxy-tetrahydrodipicolinate synthase
MVGTGAASVDDAIALTRHARDLGFAGALILPPFYYKNVAEDGVFAYLSAIIAALGGRPFPIYLYNFPALSGVPYSIALTRRLIKAFPHHITGLKDSSGDLPYARGIAALDPALAVFPSNEACLEEARSGVFAGCISATANVNAALCAAAFHEGDSRALAKANAIRGSFNGVPLVAAVKLIMAQIHRKAELEAVKPPLTVLAADQRARMIAAYQQALSQE